MNLAKTMDKMETVILVCFWNIILERINDVSLLLQSEKTDLCTAVGLLKSLGSVGNDTLYIHLSNITF